MARNTQTMKEKMQVELCIWRLTEYEYYDFGTMR